MLADLLHLDSQPLLLDPVLAAEAVQDRHRELELHVVRAVQRVRVLAGLLVRSRHPQARQVLGTNGSQRAVGRLGARMLRGQLGPVRAGERRGRIGVQRQVEGRRAQRIGQPQPGAGREIQGPEQVQSRAVGGVPGHLELRAHRCKAHLAPRLVDGGAHTRAHQLPGLLEQLGGDGAVGLAGPHRLAGAERLQVGQPRGGPGELARGARIEPRRDGRVARGAQPADQRGVENGLRPPELQTIDVERVGHAGGDRQSELVEVERLPRDRRVAADRR